MRLATSVEVACSRRFQQIVDALAPEARQPVLAALDQLNGAVSSVGKPGPVAARRRSGGTP